MSYRVLATKIKSELESVSTIEKVQDYGRHTVDWDEVATFFKDSNNRIHVWIIEWNSVEPELVATGSRVFTYPHNMLLWGLLGLKDSAATQKTMEDEADSILNLFNGQKNLIGADDTKFVQPNDNPCSLEELDHSTLAGVLCHRAQIKLVYQEQRAYA